MALGVNTLLVAGLTWAVLRNHRSEDAIGELLLIGLAAAGLLAVTVTAILRLSKSEPIEGATR